MTISKVSIQHFLDQWLDSTNGKKKKKKNRMRMAFSHNETTQGGLSLGPSLGPGPELLHPYLTHSRTREMPTAHPTFPWHDHPQMQQKLPQPGVVPHSHSSLSLFLHLHLYLFLLPPHLSFHFFSLSNPLHRLSYTLTMVIGIPCLRQY